MLYLLRRRRLREGARSVGPGLGARLQLGPAGGVAPHVFIMGILKQKNTEGTAGENREMRIRTGFPRVLPALLRKTGKS